LLNSCVEIRGEEIVLEEILESFVFYITETKSRGEMLNYNVNKRVYSPSPQPGGGGEERDFKQTGYLLKPLETNSVISYN
jgi:hypothetical protein